MNVGATDVGDCGDYFQWGAVKPFVKESDCFTKGKSQTELFNAGIIDADNNLTPKYDAATQNWGDDWRMPTRADFKKLKDNCVVKIVQERVCNGKIFLYGIKYVPKNGNYIFFPVTHYMSDNGIVKSGNEDINMWTSSLGSSFNDPYVFGYERKNYPLGFDTKYGLSVIHETFSPYFGHTIRPVAK